MKIEVSGWNLGFNKIGFTNLQRTYFDYSLTQAKANTDKLLADETLLLEVSPEEVDELLHDMEVLGAIAKVGN